MITSTQPNFKTAESSPTTMPLPHGQSYGASIPQSKGMSATMKGLDSAVNNYTTGQRIMKANDAMYAKLSNKSYGGKGWGGP